MGNGKWQNWLMFILTTKKSVLSEHNKYIASSYSLSLAHVTGMKLGVTVCRKCKSHADFNAIPIEKILH